MPTIRRALITTAYGQDSIYLGRLLRSKNYQVVVLNHKDSKPQNYGHFDRVSDLSFTETKQVIDLIQSYELKEIYNLAAMSSVAESWNAPDVAMEVNGLAVERLVNSLARIPNYSEYRFFQAGSTDMVGSERIRSEESIFLPWSPYGDSKEYARKAVQVVREQNALWAVNGILTNHDSKFRKNSFVIPLISDQIVSIIKGERKNVQLSNPTIARDWAHAEDIMHGAWKMMQLPRPIDLTLATGVTLSLFELIDECSKILKIKLPVIKKQIDDARKNDFNTISVDATYAQNLLSWKPKYSGAATIMEIVGSRLSETNEIY